MLPKFDATGVRKHDLLIMTVHFMSLRCTDTYLPKIVDILAEANVMKKGNN